MARKRLLCNTNVSSFFFFFSPSIRENVFGMASRDLTSFVHAYASTHAELYECCNRNLHELAPDETEENCSKSLVINYTFQDDMTIEFCQLLFAYSNSWKCLVVSVWTLTLIVL